MLGMYSFRLLKAVALTMTIAITLWSFGIIPTSLVDAASITSVSNTLTDTDPSASSNHTISFTTPTGIANGQTVTIDFSDGPFTGTSSILATDIDVAAGTSDFSVAANCAGGDQIGVSFTGAVLTVEFCAGDGAVIAPNGSTTIEIGTNATFGVAGSNQLVNPAVTDSYAILIAGTQTDAGSTRVVIIDTVEVTASVDTTFTFTVSGVGGSQSVNGATTTGSSTATALSFGTLSAGTPSTTAQDLTVITNASQGFVVTVEQDSEFTASNGAVIDSFSNGSYEANPTAWQVPTGIAGSPETYGHWGLTSDDTDTTRVNDFAPNTWVAASTSPVVVMSFNAPTNGNTTGEGTTRVGYQVEITALQEASEEYSTRLRYIATPIF